MNRKRGFTLIELLVTLAIAAILLTIGVPAFQEMIRNNRTAAHVNEFISALNLARSEAAKRGRRVVVCASDRTDNISGCTTAGDCCATAAGNWEQGWIVFVDSDNNANVGAGDTVLRVHGLLDGGDTLQGAGQVSTYLSYSPDGFTRLANSATFQTGTLTFGLCNNNQRKTITIGNTGRANAGHITCP